MAQISAAEVSKLRKITGAGMMDCKKALEEANGNYEDAIDIIRKKGQLVASKRADREASEGVVLAKTNAAGTKGAIVVLNCETDFVAKNENFVKLAQTFLDAAMDKGVNNLDELKSLVIDGRTIEAQVTEQIGVIGEKLELPYFEVVEAAQVVAYIHPGNKLATVVGFNQTLKDAQIGKDVAMQIAAMSPIAVDKQFISDARMAKEREIAIDQTKLDKKNEGKPVAIVEKIAEGKLEKFFKENTLLNQEFIKDSKKTVGQYLKESDKDLTSTGFLRYSLNA
jgi:elongation factor Ts